MRALLFVCFGLLAFTSASLAQDGALIGDYVSQKSQIVVSRSDGQSYVQKATGFIRYNEAGILRVRFTSHKFVCEIVAEADLTGSRGELRKIEMEAPGTDGKVIERDVLLEKRVVENESLRLDEEDRSDKLRNFNLDYYRVNAFGPGVQVKVRFTLRDPGGFTYRVDAECYVR